MDNGQFGGHPQTIVDICGQTWTSVDRHGQMWTDVDRCGQWTLLVTMVDSAAAAATAAVCCCCYRGCFAVHAIQRMTLSQTMNSKVSDVHVHVHVHGCPRLSTSVHTCPSCPRMSTTVHSYPPNCPLSIKLYYNFTINVRC
jgi:hypothetical protein